MKKLSWLVLFPLLFSFRTYAFSPYENYLLSGRPTHVGLIARAKSGQDDKLSQKLLELCNDQENEKIKQAGISNLAVFKRQIQSETWHVVYFQYSGGKQYLKAAQSFEAITPELKTLINPHPRAARYGCSWLQMEWINYIRGLDREGWPTQILSMITTIKPEKESYYRSLHQTVWPGVVDQMVRGNNRNFSIFLVEIGDTLYELFYLEYMGSDFEKDDQMNREDPVNQRWWAQTDSCQQALPGEKDIWTPMVQVAIASLQKDSAHD